MAKKTAKKKEVKKAPQGVLHYLTEQYKAIGPARSAVSFLFASATGTSPFWLTSSVVLRRFMLGGIVIGAVLGYLFVPVTGKSGPNMRWYVCGLGIGVLGVLSLFALINPENKWGWLYPVSDHLMTNPATYNPLMTLFAGITAFFLVCLVCILSKKRLA